MDKSSTYVMVERNNKPTSSGIRRLSFYKGRLDDGEKHLMEGKEHQTNGLREKKRKNQLDRN